MSSQQNYNSSQMHTENRQQRYMSSQPDGIQLNQPGQSNKVSMNAVDNMRHNYPPNPPPQMLRQFNNQNVGNHSQFPNPPPNMNPMQMLHHAGLPAQPQPQLPSRIPTTATRSMISPAIMSGPPNPPGQINNHNLGLSPAAHYSRTTISELVQVPEELATFAAEPQFQQILLRVKEQTFINFISLNRTAENYVESVAIDAPTRESAQLARSLIETHFKLQLKLKAAESRLQRVQSDLFSAQGEIASGMMIEFSVPSELIGLIIGKKGARIKQIEQETNVGTINVNGETGKIMIVGPDSSSVQRARECLEIHEETLPLQPKQVEWLSNRQNVGTLGEMKAESNLMIARVNAEKSVLEIVGTQSSLHSARLLIQTQLDYVDKQIEVEEHEKSARESLKAVRNQYGIHYSSSGGGGGVKKRTNPTNDRGERGADRGNREGDRGGERGDRGGERGDRGTASSHTTSSAKNSSNHAFSVASHEASMSMKKVPGDIESLIASANHARNAAIQANRDGGKERETRTSTDGNNATKNPNGASIEDLIDSFQAKAPTSRGNTKGVSGGRTVASRKESRTVVAVNASDVPANKKDTGSNKNQPSSAAMPSNEKEKGGQDAATTAANKSRTDANNNTNTNKLKDALNKAPATATAAVAATESSANIEKEVEKSFNYVTTIPTPSLVVTDTAMEEEVAVAGKAAKSGSCNSNRNKKGGTRNATNSQSNNRSSNLPDEANTEVVGDKNDASGGAGGGGKTSESSKGSYAKGSAVAVNKAKNNNRGGKANENNVANLVTGGTVMTTMVNENGRNDSEMERESSNSPLMQRQSSAGQVTTTATKSLLKDISSTDAKKEMAKKNVRKHMSNSDPSLAAATTTAKDSNKGTWSETEPTELKPQAMNKGTNNRNKSKGDDTTKSSSSQAMDQTTTMSPSNGLSNPSPQARSETSGLTKAMSEMSTSNVQKESS